MAYMDDYLRLLLAAKARVTEVSPENLDTEESLIIDVREAHEHAVGLLPNAVTIPMRDLGTRIGAVASDPTMPIVVPPGSLPQAASDAPDDEESIDEDGADLRERMREQLEADERHCTATYIAGLYAVRSGAA